MKIYELVEIHKAEEETTSTIGFYTDENLAKDWLTYMQVAKMLDSDSGGFFYTILHHEILEKQPWNHFGGLR